MITIENTTDSGMAPMLNNTASLGGIAETSIKPYNILTIVIGIVTMVFNGLLLIVMLRNKSTILASKFAYLIVNVAIADLLTGLNSFMWGLQNAFRLPQAVVKAMFPIYWTSIGVSFPTIFVMSLERYIAIAFPFKAQVLLSKKRTILSCVAVWLFSALTGVCVAFFPLIASFCLIVVFEITILITMFFYYKIFIKLRQRRACLPSTHQTCALGTTLQRQYQQTTVVVALTFILIVTVLPYLVGMQIMYVLDLFNVTNRDRKLLLFLHYYLPVELMNFVLNPIVYAWRLPNYRSALLRTLHFR